MSPDPIAAYLAQLRRALSPLSEAVRADIVREIESHLRERAAASPPQGAITSLGPPEDLARHYLEDHQMTDALNRPNPGALLLAMLNRSGRSVLAVTTGFGAVMLYLFALAFLIIAVMKPVTPGNVGYWPSAHTLGAVYGAPVGGPEALGYWIVPIAVAAALVSYLGGTQLLRSAGRVLLRRGRVAAALNASSPGLSD